MTKMEVGTGLITHWAVMTTLPNKHNGRQRK